MKNKKTIAIQGAVGSFHHLAAQQYFGDGTEIISCKSFCELSVRAADVSLCDGGLMAIENSIAGSILPNYSLLQKSSLQVNGEMYLRVEHQLLVNKGVEFNDICEVYSHPMAFLQCSVFLEKFGWKQIEKTDTSSAAKDLLQSKSRSAAAIASSFAARLYNLDIIKPNMQNEEENYTRFLSISPQHNDNLGECNKASVYFVLKNTPGALASVLSAIHAHGVNLSKIQSCPLLGRVWEYGFHLDMEFEDISQFNDAMHNIKYVIKRMRTYGIYKRGSLV